MSLHVEMDVPSDPVAITAALTGLTALDVYQMGQRQLPPLYSTGVLYRREKGREVWQPAEELLAAGEGDCEDLACYRAAELQRGGELARVEVITTGEGTYHAVVRRASGQIEDPSRLMLAREEQMKPSKTKISIRPVGEHYIGSVSIPTSKGTVRMSQLGFDPWSALQKALHSVYDTMQEHPELVAIVSPQAALALKVAKKISDMSPEALKLLISDDRATDAQKKLAQKILSAKADGTEPSATTAASFWAPKVAGVGAAARYPTGVTRGRTQAEPGIVQTSSKPITAITVRDHRSGSPKAPAPGAPPPAAVDESLVTPGIDTRELEAYMREHGVKEATATNPAFFKDNRIGPTDTEVYQQRAAQAYAVATQRAGGAAPDVTTWGQPDAGSRQYGSEAVPLPGIVQSQDGTWQRAPAPPRSPFGGRAYPPGWGAGPDGQPVQLPPTYPGMPGQGGGGGGTNPWEMYAQGYGDGGIWAPWDPSAAYSPYGQNGPGYPPPGYPVGYPYGPMMQYGGFGYGAEPLTADEQAALQLWGQDAFADGAFPAFGV